MRTKLKSLSVALIGLSALTFATVGNAATKTAKATPKKTTKASAKTVTKTTTTTTVQAPSYSSTGGTLTPILTEPTLSTVTYPKLNAVTFVGTDVMAQPIAGLATPNIKISQSQFIPTVLVPKTTTNTGNLDVSVVDDFIAYAMPMARHYPPVFPTKTIRYNTTQRVKGLAAWMETYAKDPNASYDVLLRAAKLNAMGRNLDLGSDYAIRAGDYIARAIKQKDTGEANFLYGMMLAEGGGFNEGEKYLDKAAKMGYAEAYQSMAQSDLLNDKRDRALQRLNTFKAQYPNDPYIDRQLAIVNSGKYYIWDLPAQTTP